MIAPDWAITAYHCVDDYSRSRAVGTIWGGGYDAEPTFHEFNTCYMRPFELADGRLIDECGDGEGDSNLNVPEHDLALVHLEGPVRGLPYRSIEPPRGCAATSEFRFAFRGEGPGGYGASRNERLTTFGTGMRLASTAIAERFRGASDLPTLFEPGDSGGGFTRADDDETGPIVGLASDIPRASPGNVRGSILWEPSNIEWIWSVLDASGSCGIGSGPCVLREPVPEGGSACGDQHCTGTETFLLCPSDCSPALADADGDGLPDMRDLCPYLDARTLDADRIALGNHIDADGNRMGDDCTPADCEDLCGPDPDRDGIPSDCDICPDDWDPEQLDSDFDGIGDACDNCPGDENLTQANSDGDRYGDACDNCPGMDNPLQTNCNEDAEDENPDPTQPQGYGDLCDPVPCGDTRIEATVRDEVVDGRPGRVIRMDQLRVDGIASEDVLATAGFRFCRCPAASLDDPAARMACASPIGSLTGCTIGDTSEYDTSRESGVWRQSAVDHQGAPVVRLDDDLDGLRREAVFTYNPAESSFIPDLYATWRHDLDTARWSGIAESEQQLVEEGLLDTGARRFPDEEGDYWSDAALVGVFWTHTPREAVPSAGAFVAGSDLPPDERLRASHYWFGPIAPPSRLAAFPPFPCLNYVGPLVGGSACTLCDAMFPAPFIATGGSPSGGGCGGAPTPPLLALPELPVDLGSVLAFDPGLIFSQESVRWLTPAEPAEWLAPEMAFPPTALRNGGGNSRLRLVGLDVATFEPVYTFVQTDNGLAPLGQPQQPPFCDNPNNCNEPVDPPLMRSDASVPRSTVDTSEPVLVLSARRETLWQIKDDGRVVEQSLTPPSIREVDRFVPEIVGRVLAATYRANDDSLYVLSETRAGGGSRGRAHSHRRSHRTKLRLVRISFQGPALAGEVVSEWPRLGWNTQFAISPDPSGALWVMASGGANRHVAFRLEEVVEAHSHRSHVRHVRHSHSARWRATGWTAGPGDLSTVSGTADRRGVSFTVQDRGGIQQAIGYRVADLRRVRGRDLDRCF